HAEHEHALLEKALARADFEQRACAQIASDQAQAERTLAEALAELALPLGPPSGWQAHLQSDPEAFLSARAAEAARYLEKAEAQRQASHALGEKALLSTG